MRHFECRKRSQLKVCFQGTTNSASALVPFGVVSGLVGDNADGSDGIPPWNFKDAYLMDHQLGCMTLSSVSGQSD